MCIRDRAKGPTLGRSLRVRPGTQRQPAPWRSLLLIDPGEDGAGVSYHRPVGQLERRQLRRSSRLTQVVARAFAEERDRTAVSGDHLVVLDAGSTERLLHAATRMDARATVIAVANE